MSSKEHDAELCANAAALPEDGNDAVGIRADSPVRVSSANPCANDARMSADGVGARSAHGASSFEDGTGAWRSAETCGARLHRAWTDAELRACVPFPSADANKYSRGVLTVVAGSDRYPGAACLAARAGQRAGAGYTEVVTTRKAAKLVLGAFPSVVVHDVGEWSPDNLRVNAKGGNQAVCIGPGFVAGAQTSDKLVVRTLKKACCPVLVDGGALAALGTAKARQALARRSERGLCTVVTPHAGEAARLARAFGVAADGPVQLAASLSRQMGAIVVLKGPDTYVAAGDTVHPVYDGTPALAKAGTGDVLAGMVAALLAQGLDPVAACVLGVALHARAGATAARTFTDVAVTPEDVVEAIPQAIKSLT